MFLCLYTWTCAIKSIEDKNCHLTTPTQKTQHTRTMKYNKVLATILLLLAFGTSFIVASRQGQKKQGESASQEEKTRVVALEKYRLQKNLAFQKVEILEREMESLGKMTTLEIKDLDPYGTEFTPEVLRDRVRDSGPFPPCESLAVIVRDTDGMIHRAIMAQEVLKIISKRVGPDSNPQTTKVHLSSAEFEAGYHAADVRLEDTQNSYSNRMLKIDEATWENIPESRRDELRAEGTLKFN